MELEKLDITGIEDIYAISIVKREFIKAVNEKWKSNPPWGRYLAKLQMDLAVLEQEKDRAIDLAQFEKLSGTEDLYSIRHPGSRKNVRIIYTIFEDQIILLTAFLEKNKGDYLQAIKCAKSRLDWLKSD